MPRLIEEVFGIDTNKFNNDSSIGRTELNEKIDFNQKSGLHNPSLGLTNADEIKAQQEVFNKVEAELRLTSWQKTFKDRVYHKQDTIVAVPPAAGKTSPILKAWFELLKQAIDAGVHKTSPEFPRILYIAKTRQLATENRIQNFIGDKDYGLFALACEYPNYFIPRPIARTGLITNKTPLDSDPKNSDNEVQQIYQSVNGMVGFLIDKIQVSVLKSSDWGIKPIIVSTPKDKDNASIVSFLREYSKWFSIIVIDEFQEYVPKPSLVGLPHRGFNEGESNDFNLAKGLIYNAQKAGKCGVQILTGTINKNTLDIFKDEANRQFKRNFDLICEYDPKTHINNKSNPEFTANRSLVKIVPFEKMQNNQQLQDLIINIVKAKQSNSIVVIFSNKRASNTGIFRILEDVLSKLPARYQTTTINPKTDIKTGEITNERNVDKYANKTLSGSRLNNPTLNKLKDTFASNYIHPDYEPNLQPQGLETEKVSDIEFLKYFSIDEVEDRDAPVGKAITYEGNLLYQGVLRGIGVMVGKMPDRYKATIQKLFRDKKIYVILATDSLGIGANVLAQHLYIPNLSKFSTDENKATGMQPIDISSIIQLVNRAGRSPDKIPYATIYCALKDYKNIEAVVNADPSIATPELDSEAIKKKLGEVKYLQFLWDKING